MNSSELTQHLSRLHARRWVGLLATPVATRQWALGVFLLALVLRTAYALIAPHVDPFLVSNPLLGDAASYDRVARTLLSGGAYGEYAERPSVFWPPLFPFLLTAIYKVFGYNLMAGRVVLAILGALLPMLAYLAVSKIERQPIAVLTGVGLVFYPYLVYFGAWLIAEGLYFALLGWILWIGVRLQQKPSLGPALLFGLACALAILAKPTHLFQLLFLGIWFLCCFVAVRWWRRLALGVFTAAVIVLGLAPWVYHNYHTFGTLILVSTNGGYTFYGANNADAFGGHYEHFPPGIPDLSEAEEQAAYYRLGIAWITSNPQAYLELTGRKLTRLISPLSVASSPQDFRVPAEPIFRLLYALFLIASASGLVLSLRDWRQYYLFYTPILGVFLSTVIFYGDTRFTLPAVPSLVLFASLGCFRAFERITNGSTIPDS